MSNDSIKIDAIAAHNAIAAITAMYSQLLARAVENEQRLEAVVREQDCRVREAEERTRTQQEFLQLQVDKLAGALNAAQAECERSKTEHARMMSDLEATRHELVTRLAAGREECDRLRKQLEAAQNVDVNCQQGEIARLNAALAS